MARMQTVRFIGSRSNRNSSRLRFGVPQQPDHVERAALVPGLLDVLEAVGFEHLTALQSSVDQHGTGRGKEEQQLQMLTDSEFQHVCVIRRGNMGEATLKQAELEYEIRIIFSRSFQEVRDDDTEKAYLESVE